MPRIAEVFVDIKARMGPLKKGLARAVGSVRQAAAKMRNAVKRVAIAFAVLGAAIGALAAFIASKSLRAWAAQEEAEIALASALATTGQEVDQNLARYKKLASEIQRTTKFGDEFTIQLGAAAAGLGVQGDQIGEVVKGAIGLATKLRQDLNPQLLRYAVLAKEGEFTMLQRYIPSLRAATTQAEKFAIVQQFMAEGFSQAQAETKTLAGRTAQLRNAFGDLLEAIGKELAPGATRRLQELTDVVIGLTRQVGPAFEKLRGVMQRVGEKFDEIFGTRFASGVTNPIIEIIVAFEALRLKIRDLLFELINRFKIVRAELTGSGTGIFRVLPGGVRGEELTPFEARRALEERLGVADRLVREDLDKFRQTLIDLFTNLRITGPGPGGVDVTFGGAGKEATRARTVMQTIQTAIGGLRVSPVQDRMVKLDKERNRDLKAIRKNTEGNVNFVPVN